ncbi:DUF4406 domain-containing protein [Clostridium sp. CF012]|uniref:DUF4406 domain-containing protein n=1 Tax=Clostridium sp. CF012 TaxID=2843319 RepID=UPI001C0CC1C2|nr:DUF4406 domain-containing protein [Clostridium sp. CF012]MBU3145747.1 DUF4406 domain-containing protein [Clostridium sp. CF012]
MNKNIYIAGKITGSENFKEIFKAAEVDLRERGFVPMNPATLNGGFEHADYMHICYSMIDVCDTVYLLIGWQESKGAVMEYEYARKNHKDIIREGEKTLKICIVGRGWQPHKFDKFELAGFNLTEDQKNAFNRLGIALEKLRALIKVPEKTLAEKCLNLFEEFEPLQFSDEIKSKTKNWNRKRFYD